MHVRWHHEIGMVMWSIEMHACKSEDAQLQGQKILALETSSAQSCFCPLPDSEQSALLIYQLQQKSAGSGALSLH